MAEEARKELDAIELLMQDHREVESLFSEFDYLEQKGQDTEALIVTACDELETLDALKNDIFYPAVSDAGGDEAIEALLDEAEDAHDAVLDLIEDLEQMDGDAARNAQFKLIAEQVKQQILQEESELFPQVKQLKPLDLDSLAAQMKTRRDEIVAKDEPAEISEASA